MSSGINNVKLHFNNIYITARIIILTTLFLFYCLPSQGQDTKKWVIVIDAGHGGKDPGALGYPNASGTVSREKDIALAIALKTGDYIEKNIPGVKVIYTRKNDTFVELRDRANIANKNKADLFISIHVNWAKSKSIKGTETYIMGTAKDQQNLEVAMKENEVIYLEEDFSTKYEGFDPKSEVSYIMFTVRQKEFQAQSTSLASKIQTQFRESAERYDRTVKQAGFWVLYTTTMPSVLVETGFITNPEEERYLLSKKGQDNLASAIYRACKEYINDIEKRSIISTAKYEDQNLLTKADTIQVITSKGSINFRVQIGSSTIKKEITPQNFKGMTDVSEISSDNRYRYVSGSFNDYQAAMEYRKILQAKYPDAFVIAIRDNKLLPLQEALEESKK